MRKKQIIILISVILLLLFISLGGYIYYDLFIPDDYGEKYYQTWQSNDGSISIVVDNKKGFMGHNNRYKGKLIYDNEETDIEFGFALICEVFTSEDDTRVFAGSYSYNPLFNQVSVDISDVNSKYSDYFKVGEKLIIEKE